MPSLPRELPVLLTPRGRLRPFDGRDAADLFAIYGDPLVMRFVGEPPFPSLATVSQMLASVERLLAGGESLEWGLELRGSGRLVGTCGLHSFAAGASLRQAEVGCMLARSHWGQGLMGEALSALIVYARQLGIVTLLADIEPDNLPSQRLFERLGFIWQQDTCYRLLLGEEITPDRA
ncbi:GNAT family N-acetyltransferase [Aeromonas caviae]|uniref:GNAT family N-acetyltransferase n=1 Tax=Aeromonas TaxID=642 RepID=UPI00227DE7C1|nr:GNAT family N-acetyltransferase [Aeromonas caviae]MCY9812199.1 GNAT family N-acetyltransferase [Aeromonas caviae]WAF59850.1 GNAT family N-acetyltransferase [Aeromonas caviae]WAF63909.1 GNAT family N-acetyltransferase [Aeromonas caviae]WAF80739.1 GNAT family N-acetyltransferase [Aeromonas caviae]